MLESTLSGTHLALVAWLADQLGRPADDVFASMTEPHGTWASEVVSGRFVALSLRGLALGLEPDLDRAVLIEHLRALDGLQRLDLMGAGLTRFPADGLEQLRALDLSDNGLTSLELGTLTQLKRLNVAGNRPVVQVRTITATTHVLRPPARSWPAAGRCGTFML